MGMDLPLFQLQDKVWWDTPRSFCWQLRVLEGLFGAENPEQFLCVRILKPGHISLKPSLLGLDLIHWNCPQGLGDPGSWSWEIESRDV